MNQLYVDGKRRGMNQNPALPAFIQPTTTGLILAKDLTFTEWEAIAAGFGSALRMAAWCIGDWMVYGERKWGKQMLLEGEDFDPQKAKSHPFPRLR